MSTNQTFHLGDPDSHEAFSDALAGRSIATLTVPVANNGISSFTLNDGTTVDMTSSDANGKPLALASTAGKAGVIAMVSVLNHNWGQQVIAEFEDGSELVIAESSAPASTQDAFADITAVVTAKTA